MGASAVALRLNRDIRIDRSSFARCSYILGFNGGSLPVCSVDSGRWAGICFWSTAGKHHEVLFTEDQSIVSFTKKAP